MVKFLFLLFGTLCAIDVSIVVSVDAERAAEQQPLEAMVSVRHPVGLKVDEMSFSLDGQPLPATFLHDATQSSLTIVGGVRRDTRSVISSYRVMLPGQDAGRHQLGPISLLVSGECFTSEPSSYFVFGSESSSDFQLYAYIEGPENRPLYPGERARLVYRIHFRHPIETTYQELPFLEPEGLRKIGTKQVRTDYSGGMTVQEISQEVEATTPGRFSFPSACVEGFPYRKDFFGRPAYERRKLRAEAPPLDLIVSALPPAKPSAYDGAIGSYSLDAKLLSPSAVGVGDRLRLELTVRGEGSFSTLHPPKLGEAFSDQFRLSDLPPESREVEGAKTYVLELRPLSSEVSEIPPIALPFFDPVAGRYRTVKSDPIPIEVTALATAAPPPPPRPAPPRKLEIASAIPLTKKDLRSSAHPFWGLLIFPAGATVLALKRVRRRRPKEQPISNLADAQRALERLPKSPQIEDLLARIDAARFGGGEPSGLLKEALEEL